MVIDENLGRLGATGEQGGSTKVGLEDGMPEFKF